MKYAGVALMVAGVVSFGVGFYWSPESRCRLRANVATIVSVYVGLVLVLSSTLVGSSAP